jgi:hypothetical protein
VKRLVVVVACAGCGRIGFDPSAGGDGAPFDAADAGTIDAAPVVDLPCGTPFAVGTPLPDTAGDGSSVAWLSTASAPNGILVSYTGQGGVLGLAIDLRTMPLARSSPVVVAAGSAGNLDVTRNGDRVLWSSRGATGAGTEITITDLDFATISPSRNEPLVGTSAPDSAAPHPNGFVVVGSSVDTAELVFLDADGAMQGARKTWPFTGSTGGTIAQAGGGYAAIWYDNDTTELCELKRIDASGVEMERATLSGCRYARVDSQPGASQLSVISMRASAMGVDGAVMTDLGIPTPWVDLYPTAFQPPRMAVGADGYWSVFPDGGSLRGELLDTSGDDVTQMPITLGPYTQSASFLYDAVAREERVYAVWLDGLLQPQLYVARLCL